MDMKYQSTQVPDYLSPDNIILKVSLMSSLKKVDTHFGEKKEMRKNLLLFFKQF